MTRNTIPPKASHAKGRGGGLPGSPGGPSPRADSVSPHRGVPGRRPPGPAPWVRPWPPPVAEGSTPGVDTLLTALEAVRDPELDEPITSLGFVASCTVSAAGDAQVRLRLPTYFCAPNFAFLMVADAYDAVSAVPGVRSTEVMLEEHFASDAINGGVAARAGFVHSFDGEAVSELHGLRADFLRKAVMAGTDQVCRPLLAAGTSPADLPGLSAGRRAALARAGPAAAAPGRAGPAQRRRCTAADRPGHGGTGRRRRDAAAPAPGAHHPDQHRGEQRHLPWHAAAPVRRNRTQSAGPKRGGRQ